MGRFMFIDTAFDGGNVQVDRIDGDHVYFRPDPRDTEGYWFYWYFAVRNAGGRTLHFHPVLPNMLTRHAPACSIDQGQHWQWLDPQVVQADESFTVTIPDDVEDYSLSMGMPYVQSHLDAFVQRYGTKLQIRELCRSDKGRQVASLHCGPAVEQADYRLFLTARHHCCEAMASYVLEGLLAAALADNVLGQWWQEHVHVTAIPFVDVDGVAAGDQGKNRRPRDHNRDYDEKSIYPQTRAIMALAESIIGYGNTVAFDLHCPWIAHQGNEAIYQVGIEAEYFRPAQHRFAQLLKAAITGPLTYDPADDVPFGTAWNTGANHHQGCNFAKWVSRYEQLALCGALEIPYAIVRQGIIDQDNARLFGRDLADAIKSFLQAGASNES